MKAAIVSPSLTRNAGGILDSLRGLTAELAKAGVSVDVLGLEEPGVEKASWQGVLPRTFPVIGPRQFGLSTALRDALSHDEYDLVHQHALWMYPSVAVSAWHKLTGRPYIVSPHGMLDAWALANSRWKKKIASAFFEKRNLQNAACLHALCEAEAAAMRDYGLRNPIAVVPNGVALQAQRCDEWRVTGDESARLKTLLFLGRLHPKKGLPDALRGWAEVTRGGNSGWRFVIAGWDKRGHEAALKRMCGELGVRYVEAKDQGTSRPEVAVKGEEWRVAGDDRRSEGGGRRSEVGGQRSTGGEAGDGSPQRPKAGGQTAEVGEEQENSVVFAGPAFGETKEALLRSADAFILPSLSEGLPMSVLEAWAYELPVLMTEECNLPEGFAAGAAIKVAAKSEGSRVMGDELGAGSVSVLRLTSVSEAGGQRAAGVAVALRELMEMTDEERAAMGARGRKLVEEKFTWPKVAAQMKEVYEWVLGNGPKPSCVQTLG